MAVRRISDLPELKSNYPAAALSSSLIEVSYSPRNAVYQSFYAKMNDVLSILVDNMPRATHSQFGIVKIGPNISVIENDSDPNKGLINVPPASTSKLGLVKIGSNITVDENGVISTSQATISQTVKPPNATEIAKINSTSIYAPTVDVQPDTTATGPTLATIRVGSVVKEIKGAETVANVRVEPIAHGTEIAKIYVNGTETALSDSVDANAFKGFLGFPNYSSSVSYNIYSCNNGSGRPIIFRFAVPFDAFLILDRRTTSGQHLMQNIIGSYLTPGFTITDGLNAEQWGYYAKADDIIYAKALPSSSKNPILAGTITVYPLTNGDVSTSTDVINVTDKNFVTAQELYIKCKALNILDTFKMYGSTLPNVAPPVAGNDWPTTKWTEITNPDDTRTFHNVGISIKLKADYIGQINYTYGGRKKSAAIEDGRLYNIIIARTSYNHGPYKISQFGNIRFTCQSINRRLVAQYNNNNPPEFIEFDYSQIKWNYDNLVTYPNQWPTEE